MQPLLGPALCDGQHSSIGTCQWHAAGSRGSSTPRTPVGMTQRRMLYSRVGRASVTPTQGEGNEKAGEESDLLTFRVLTGA